MTTSKKIKLQYPVKHGSEEITELEVQRPKGKDLKKLKKGETMAESLELLSSLCNVPPSVMDDLDLVDINQISEVVESFLESGKQ